MFYVNADGREVNSSNIVNLYYVLGNTILNGGINRIYLMTYMGYFRHVRTLCNYDKAVTTVIGSGLGLMRINEIFTISAYSCKLFTSEIIIGTNDKRAIRWANEINSFKESIHYKNLLLLDRLNSILSEDNLTALGSPDLQANIDWL